MTTKMPRSARSSEGRIEVPLPPPPVLGSLLRPRPEFEAVPPDPVIGMVTRGLVPFVDMLPGVAVGWVAG